MTSPEVEAAWYEALGSEDSLRVLQLLKEHNSLLKVGWESDTSRKVSVQNTFGRRDEIEWKRRTALHVGVRRGCIELIKQVLILFNLKALDQSDLAESKRAARDDQNGSDDSAESGEQKVLELGNAASEISSVAAAGQGETLSNRAGQQAAQLTVAHWQSPDGSSKATIAQRTFAPWKRKLRKPGETSKPTKTSLDLDSNREQPISPTPMQPPLTEVGGELDGNLEIPLPGNSISRAYLRDLLVAKDGRYELDALSMAAMAFNVDIILLLTYACGECDEPPYGMSRCTVSPHELNDDDKAQENRDLLRNTTQEVIDSFGHDPTFCECLEAYSKDWDFNFLPREEYLFHFLCSTSRWAAYREALWKKVRSFPAKLWHFLLELHDSQGRTPTHVALDSIFGDLKTLMTLVKDGGDDEKEVVICTLTTLDAAGRTPAYRAVASGHDEESCFLLEQCREYPEVSVSCAARFQHCLQTSNPFLSRNLSTEFQSNFERLRTNLRFDVGSDLNPIHASILFRRGTCAKLWIEASLELHWGDVAFYEKQWRFNRITQSHEQYMTEWDPIEFAYLVEPDTSLSRIQPFLKERALSTRRSFSRCISKDGTEMLKHPCPILHIVADCGNFQSLKFLIDDSRCDPFLEDYEGNSVLHQVMKVRKIPEFSLLACVNSEKFMDLQLLDKERRTHLGLVLDEKAILGRQGCINLLLRKGCNILKENNGKEFPYPDDTLSNNAKFLSWWYEKEEKEFVATQHNLNFAANAISVTATLVATASYLGPLQPPMGYADDSDQLQVGNSWVLLFIIFDTISFYLAVAAITLSLIPSLPMPRQSMTTELIRTRRMVAWAVAVLFPSIVFIFVAFSCSSFAVLSASLRTLSTGVSLLIATTCIGGLFCLGTFFLFFVRLLALIFPRNTWVRYFYEIARIKK